MSVKSKDLAREVERAGGVLARTKGDHHLYRLPNGRIIAVPRGGRHNDVSPGVLACVRRALRELEKGDMP